MTEFSEHKGIGADLILDVFRQLAELGGEGIVEENREWHGAI